jgi:hypothetical protein
VSNGVSVLPRNQERLAKLLYRIANNGVGQIEVTRISDDSLTEVLEKLVQEGSLPQNVALMRGTE